MRGLFGQVKEEKPRQKRNLEREIDNMLRKKDLSQFMMNCELDVKNSDLEKTLKIMEAQGKIKFNASVQKWQKIWRRE